MLPLTPGIDRRKERCGTVEMRVGISSKSSSATIVKTQDEGTRACMRFDGTLISIADATSFFNHRNPISSAHFWYPAFNLASQSRKDLVGAWDLETDCLVSPLGNALLMYYGTYAWIAIGCNAAAKSTPSEHVQCNHEIVWGPDDFYLSRQGNAYIAAGTSPDRLGHGQINNLGLLRTNASENR